MEQKQIWENIAPEWHEFKTNPSQEAITFLEKQTGKVLDLGSGSGRHLKKIKDGKMYLVDFSEKMIELAKEKSKKQNIKAEFQVAPITDIHYENNFFDSAICIAALHCVEGEKNREKVVKEIFRVLKQGAKAQIIVWNKNSSRFKNAPKEKYIGWRDKGKRYYYLFEPEEIYELFKKQGFKIIEKLPSDVNIIFIVQK